MLCYLIGGKVGVDDVEAWCRARWGRVGCRCGGIGLIDGRYAGVASADVDDYEAAWRGGDYGGDGLEYGYEVAPSGKRRDCCADGEVTVGVEKEGVIEGKSAEVVGTEA